LSVICQVCKRETRNYVFDKDLKPICKVCVVDVQLQKDLVSVHEARLKTAWNGKDNVLSNWLR
jgi:hypothetical protein